MHEAWKLRKRDLHYYNAKMNQANIFRACQPAEFDVLSFLILKNISYAKQTNRYHIVFIYYFSLYWSMNSNPLARRREDLRTLFYLFYVQTNLSTVQWIVTTT